MPILNKCEREFLDVFLHEATTPPFFNGPASKALHGVGVEYKDISYIAWAYEKDVPRTRFEIGHEAEVAPPLPWPDRATVLRRNEELHTVWEQEHQLAASSKAT